MTGVRAPTKRTSGMTRVSKSCTLVVEPYCFNSPSGSVEDRQRNGRKGSAEKRTEGTTAVSLDFRPPLDSLAHLSTNNAGLNVLLLYHYVTVMRETDLQLDNSLKSRFAIKLTTPRMKRLMS